MARGTGSFDDAVAALRRADAIVFPTDTVYGLGVAVDAARTPEVLYRLKERDRGKPIAWLVGGADDLDRYGEGVPDLARTLARMYWPGPLTLIVKAAECVPEAFQSAEGTIGLRMPDNSVALELIARVGCPLATTSANLSGCASPCSYEAIDPALAARVRVIVADESDADKSGLASTVLDCTRDLPVVVREGAVTAKDVRSLL